jgi:ribosomal protein L37AE/L43A
VDVDLIEEVGLALLRRCRSILIATEAHEGRARCPRCSNIILHHWVKAEVITCSGCGWQTTWGAYLKTYQSKQLHGGGAVPAFKAYVEQYELAETPRERMLLIDRLIHAFHYELTDINSRPAGCNLIEGTIAEVIDFLDTLTYGEASTPGTREIYRLWIDKAQARDYCRWVLDDMRNKRTREGD